MLQKLKTAQRAKLETQEFIQQKNSHPAISPRPIGVDAPREGSKMAPRVTVSRQSSLHAAGKSPFSFKEVGEIAEKSSPTSVSGTKESPTSPPINRTPNGSSGDADQSRGWGGVCTSSICKLWPGF
jgi:hypothetical protein